MTASETLNFENARAVQALYLNDPQNLRLVEEKFGVKLTTREGWLKIEGPQDGLNKAKDVFEQLHYAKEKGLHIRKHEFKFAMEAVINGKGSQLADLHASRIQLSLKKPPVVPKTLQQKCYVDLIKTNDMVFGVGPAGSGKTFLAMAMAVAALKNEEVTRIVLTRPAVEAGEALGFLPGDLQEKIFPYLRPLYDALYDMLDQEEIQRYMDKGIIEIAPLAYMRGRTLSNSFVILDEAQNTTTEQMFMFLTRIGQESKCVVTGDPTQVDLPNHRKSGLIEAIQALNPTEGIGFVRFDEVDVIRHELVQRIIRAYKAHRGEKTTSMAL
jgi:phosphate starvation-inducible protein PhoH and related proteins